MLMVVMMSMFVMLMFMMMLVMLMFIMMFMVIFVAMPATAVVGMVIVFLFHFTCILKHSYLYFLNIAKVWRNYSANAIA